VRRWVRESILFPFFWFRQVTVTNSVARWRVRSECGMIFRFRSREDEVSEFERLGPARRLCFDNLAGTGREEEARDEQVDGVIDGTRGGRSRGAEAVKVPQELGGNGPLPVRRVPYVVEGLEEGCEGREEPGAVRDVKGTWFEIVPERHSQMACGSADRRSRQGLRICSKKPS
jgi:hypothetical protein